MDVQLLQPFVAANSIKEMEFRTLGDFDDGHAGVFWSEAGGPSPWEMHPTGDELLYVLEGEIAIEVLPDDGGPASTTRVATGEMIVVPRGRWHRHDMLKKTKEFYLTPGKSLHSTDEDPRS